MHIYGIPTATKPPPQETRCVLGLLRLLDCTIDAIITADPQQFGYKIILIKTTASNIL